MVNDAVAMILSQSVLNLVGGDNNKQFYWYTVFILIGQFLLVAVCSIIIGLFFGNLNYVTPSFWHSEFHSPRENPGHTALCKSAPALAASIFWQWRSPGKYLNLGMLCTLMIKRFKFLTESAVIEACMIFFFGFASYITCEICEVSGIVAILVCGIFMAHYQVFNLSTQGFNLSTYTASTLHPALTNCDRSGAFCSHFFLSSGQSLLLRGLL